MFIGICEATLLMKFETLFFTTDSFLNELPIFSALNELTHTLNASLQYNLLESLIWYFMNNHEVDFSSKENIKLIQ